MRVASGFAGGALFLVLSACAPTGDVRGREASAFDRVVLSSLASHGITPEYAGEDELCTRLFVDTLGARPSRETLLSRCAGRPLEDVVDELLASEAYRWTQRRRWADEFRYNDAFVDRISIRDLDKLVDQLYLGELSYEQFAIQAIAHPGFVGRYLAYSQEDTIAAAAFTVFLGRPPTAPEAEDLTILWAPWQLNPTAPASAPLIDPFRCEAGKSGCVSTILGFAAVELEREGRSALLTIDQLRDRDWEALRAPGRLFAAQPMFWESGVDRVLRNYFGWDFGSALPEAREVLGEELRQSGGDLRALERMVLLSAAYTFAAEETHRAEQAQDADRASPADTPAQAPSERGEIRYGSGPTKFLTPEAWLRSAIAFTGAELGDCDFRYPNLPDATATPPSPELDDRYPRNSDGTIDPWFRDTAAALGGCPEVLDATTAEPTKRVRNPGLEQSIATDEAALALCTEHAGHHLSQRPGEPLSSMLQRLLESALGRAAAPEEIEALRAAAAQGCPTCEPTEIARDLCAGLLGAQEYAAY